MLMCLLNTCQLGDWVTKWHLCSPNKLLCRARHSSAILFKYPWRVCVTSKLCGWSHQCSQSRTFDTFQFVNNVTFSSWCSFLFCKLNFFVRPSMHLSLSTVQRAQYNTVTLYITPLSPGLTLPCFEFWVELCLWHQPGERWPWGSEMLLRRERRKHQDGASVP